jgi:hypothetical protein
MQMPLDHDENQFVASGWLIAHAGLLPYRDFPYFHLPYLSLIYALVFQFSSYPLLAARLVEVAAAFGTTLIIYLLLRRKPRTWSGVVIGASGVLIWVFNPLTQYASGLAWNHDLALLCCLLAYAAFQAGEPSGKRSVASGIGIAIAAGIRATFLLASFAFLLFTIVGRARKATAIAWTAGIMVGSLPNLIFFAIAPSQFWFGNVSYAALNTQWRAEHEYDRAMTLDGKFAYLVGDVIGWTSTLVLLIALAVAIVVVGRRLLSAPHNDRPDGRAFWLAVTLFLVLSVGAFLPTPTFQQYFFSAVPFAVLAVGLACRAGRPAIGVPVMLMLAVVSVLAGASLFESLGRLAASAQWTPMKVHDAGATVRQAVGQDTIVTFAPVYPLEAGLSILPQLATGPFAYRVGSLLSADERRRQNIISVDDLGVVLDHEPRAALLLGFEPEELEEPLAQYAQSHYYRYQRLPSGKNLWLPH